MSVFENHSPALLAANRQLVQLQAARRQQRIECDDSKYPKAANHGTDSPSAGISICLQSLPKHLGWGSTAVSAHLRRTYDRLNESQDSGDWGKRPDHSHSRSETPRTNHTPNKFPPSRSFTKLYPDIGLGMLRQGLSAPGRLWLLLRTLDEAGSGKLSLEHIKTTITLKGSDWHLCGKRQLRNLLRDGKGVFWQRDKTYVWLRSAAWVAHSLGVARLTGRPVALPTSVLLDGIGTFRAHLYTAFHSSRMRDTPQGEKAMPIARETLMQLSGVGRSSQRTYEERVGISVHANFAVGDISTKEKLEKWAWAKGLALFELKDYRGFQGKKVMTYLAWQLPNSYRGTHQKRPMGQQKRINRKLKDLVMKGMPGNVGEMIDMTVLYRTQKPEKAYYPNGKLAAKAYGRDPERELFWQRHGTRNGRFALWQKIGG